jgi:uncharacterized membrane protein
MELHWLDFLGMLVRWLHVIAGIAWIGSSFYFIWLDRSLEPPEPGSEEARKGVGGHLWAVHGGGFYNPQKYAVAPARLPDRLHWFKWEAYTTWLSGTALLVLVYWLHAGTMMLDPGRGALQPWQAVALGAGAMAASWLVYDLLCRSALGRHDGLLGAVVFALLVALAWGLSRWLGGRAVYLHVGACIGTIMAANVFFIIIPGQRRMVAALRAGGTPDPLDGRRGKQRSVHNNYFTLPVVFTMFSHHYAATHTHPHAWAVLALIAAAGVAIRHFFNLRHKGTLDWRFPALGAALLGVAAWWTAPRPLPLPPVEGPVTFNRVRTIVGQHCVNCHAPVPTFPGLAAAPGGVLLHEPAEILRHAQRVHLQVVVTRMMPLGNVTQITDQDRAVIAAWIKAGARAD